jgi:hypothetical protein
VTDRPRRVRSRRSVLAACGAGMAALAGCSAVGIRSGDDEDPDYDAGRLAAIGREGAPSRPDAFPVTVTDEMTERHSERARELLDAVPERPEVPNGVVTRRLRDHREEVAEALDESRAEDGETEAGPHGDEEPGLERLSEARHDRADAAELLGAYRGATREIDPDWVAERRETLRSDRRSFESGRDYRGGEPGVALVVHAELEGYSDRARRSAVAWPPVPDDPATDPFSVGEIVRDLEAGRAALSDARRLRDRYLDGIDDPQPFRSAITVTAHRLDRRASFRWRGLHEYLDAGPDDLPFDRSLDGTPAIHLFARAKRTVDLAVRGAEEAMQAGNQANAVLAGTRRIAGLRAFESVIDAIEDGKYDSPDDADRVAAARADAVEALEAAWGTSPVALSDELAFPAHDALRLGVRRLEGARNGRHDVNRAFASLAYARLYAEAVPDIHATTTRYLDSAANTT